MKGVMKQVDMKLCSRIRVIIWKQWKVPKKQIKSLIQLGIPEEKAKGLPIYRIIESCSKSNLESKTKEEGSPFFFRTISKSSHCNIN